MESEDIVEVRWFDSGERMKGKITKVQKDGTLTISNLYDDDEDLEVEFEPTENKLYRKKTSLEIASITLKVKRKAR